MEVDTEYPPLPPIPLGGDFSFPPPPPCAVPAPPPPAADWGLEILWKTEEQEYARPTME